MLFLQVPKSIVSALAFSPDGELLAVGSNGGAVALIRNDGGTMVEYPAMAGALDFTISLVYRNDGTLLRGGRGYFASLNPVNWAWTKTDFPEQSYTAIANLDSTRLAVGTAQDGISSGCFELWDTERNSRMVPYFLEQNGVYAVAAHSASRTVAWVNNYKRLSLWHTTAQQPWHIQLSHNATSLAFHPDGETLAIGIEWLARIFTVKTRNGKCNLKGHTGRVAKVAYHPAGHILATGSWDRTVRLWDAATGSLLSTFDWQIGRVTALAFAADGLRLAAGGEEGKIVVWDME